MNPDSPDLHQRLQQLETEINPPQEQPPRASSSASASPIGRVWQWFEQLPNGGRVITLLVAAVVVLTMLSLLLQLVALAVKLGILAIVLLAVYRVVSQWQRSQP